MKSISRIFDVAYHQLENHPLKKALVTKYNGHWEALSTQEYIDRANKLSRGLLKLGVKPGDKIAVISTANCSEWNILDIGILQIGAQNVPIYPTSSSEAYHYILTHSEAKYVFVSDREVLAKTKAATIDSSVQEIFSFTELEDCSNWGKILALGEDLSLQHQVDKLKSQVKPDDLATLIYTSGTTGKPKGVMLTHRNLVSNLKGSAPRVPFETGTQTALSYLPVCHVFERLLIYLYQYYSISIVYAESIEALSDNFKEVKPTFVTAVPRVLEKVYAAFRRKGNETKGIKRALFYWALGIAKAYQPYQEQSLGYRIQLNLARKLVLSKWKAGLGGRLDLIVSGSAPLSPELSRIYAAAQMQIIEGYGLTETSPVIAVNTTSKEYFKLGTVGKPLDNLEVKIAEDGEILVKGPSIMKQYYKDGAKTKAAFTEDGYFYTGDIGTLDEEGFLTITDRKKQLFKTSGGKYISPQMLENQLNKSQFIENIMVIGEGEKMPAALIQLNLPYVKSWLAHKELSVDDDSLEGLSKNQIVIDRIQREIDQCNKHFGRWEQIKVFKLTPDEWSIEAGHLTPTLKVKRKVVLKIYRDLYDEIYKEY